MLSILVHLIPIKAELWRLQGVAASLPSTYRVHILGFGNPGEIQTIKELCEEMSGKGGAVVSYDGGTERECIYRFFTDVSDWPEHAES